MATPRIGQKRNARLYVKEWLEYLGLSDETIANRIGVVRQTIWKWRHGKLRPDIIKLAHALDMEPEQFYRPPDTSPRPSLDQLVKDLPDDRLNDLVEMVKLFKKTGT